MSGYLSFEADLDDPVLAAAYDDLPLWPAMAGLPLLEHVPLPGIAALDVGCGTGFPAIEPAERLEAALPRPLLLTVPFAYVDTL